MDPGRENLAALAVVQALLGPVTPQVCGVSVVVDGHTATVHFAVTHLDEALEEDVDDVVIDVEALLRPDTPDVIKKVFVGPTGADWQGRQHRPVMLAEEPGGSLRAGGGGPTSRGTS